jgi:hypothetical protein
MTLLRALRWTLLVISSLTLLATGCWLVTGDGSWDIGVTFALIPNLLLALYFGYRLVRARVGDLMPFVAAVITTVPALILGWCAFQGLRLTYGKGIGPVSVREYAKQTHRNAVTTRLRGRMLWQDGVKFTRQQGGAAVGYTLLPFVPLDWKRDDPIRVWMLGTTHRYKQADFDGCGYPRSVPCTVTAYEPRLRELRLELLRQGIGPRRGGLDFVVLRADPDRLWFPKRLALAAGPLWLLLFTLWLLQMGRKTARRLARRGDPASGAAG